MPTLEKVIYIQCWMKQRLPVRNQLIALVNVINAVYRILLILLHRNINAGSWKLAYQASAHTVEPVHWHLACLLVECCWENFTSTVVYKLLPSNLESRATVVAGEKSCGSSIPIHPKSNPKPTQARDIMPLSPTGSAHTSTV